MTNNGKIIKDAMGQWKHPGKPTRIPGNDITMMGVNYPVYAKPNKGKGIMMYPGENYTFPKADYVDEYPINLKMPSLEKPQQGLYAFPNLDISDNVPHFGATVGYKTPKINISGNYMYGTPTVTAAFNFEGGGQHGGLDRWFAEKWVDVKTGKDCGRQEGEKRKGYPACRPSRRVSEDTPKTSGELSSSEREKFKRSKTSSERINYQHRRKENGGEINEQDMANKPNNPALWSRAKSLAKQKFDVYPSAYANGWAAKWYKGKGGTWRKAEYGMEVPYMEDGGKPEWLVEAQLKAQGYSGDALQQKMSSMAQGGEPQNAGFKALPEYVQAKILSNMAYGGMAYPFMDEGGEPNGEMAMGQMAAVSDKMSKLLQFIKPEDNVDPWIASKLAVMDHSADAISDYMTYGAEGDEEENEEEEMPEMGNGGYTVTRSNDRKGKTHKVTGPDGTVKYFGDSKLGQHPKDPERKAAFYARHKKNLDGNPFFRAFARATWKDGGSTFSGNAFYQKGGSIVDYLESMGMASDKASRKQLAAKMGIKDYDYSADKNLELLAMMRNQGVKDAPAPSTKSSKTVRREMNIPAMLRPVEQPKKGYLSMFDDLMSSVYSKNKNLESGFVVDKRKNKGYIVRNGKIEKSFPVITGSNAEGTENPYSVSYLDDNPKLRATPAGTYNMKPNKNIYGAPGYNMKPIDAFNEKAPNSRAVAVHTTYDPASRDRLYNMSPQDRYKSYGCINCRPEDIGSMTGKYFPQGDTLMVLDPKKNKYDAEFMDRLKKGKGNERYEMGGMPCYECGGMYAYGGIYIDPAKKGTFKAQATRMGMDVQEAASAILNAPEGKYSPEMRKKANFARNFAKQMGGLVEGAEVEVTPEQAELLRQQGYDFEIM
jgi:hypothetical protein